MSHLNSSESAVQVLFLIVSAVLTLLSPSLVTVSLLALFVINSIYLLLKNTSIAGGIYASTERNTNTLDQTEHKLLLESIHHLPMPYALYDENDRLCVWNVHYEKIYAKVFNSLQSADDAKKLTYGDMIRINAKGDIPNDELEEYTRNRVRDQRKKGGKVIDRCYPELGWYRVSKFVTPSGAVAGFGIDINELKERENDLVEEIEHRTRLEDEIRKIANTDMLTGISNRRHFMEKAECAFTQSRSNKESLTCLMIDIDYFKIVNDSYGHASGDDVISTIAKIASTLIVDESACVGRLGGEEFAAVLTGRSLREAAEVAERLRAHAEALSFSADNNRFTITVSIGVAESKPSETSINATMKRADEALYQAKKTGRNCVQVYSQPDNMLFSKAG